MLKTFADVLDIYNGKNQRKVENPNGQYPIYGSGGIMGYADDFICPAQTVLIGRKGSINSPIFAESPLWNVDTVFGLIAKDGVILPKYLYYFCVHFDFEKLNTTVTIPSLTKANLLKISMPVPTITEQKAITGILDKLQSIITHRKQQLEKLDELVKARFVEMFGDTEDIRTIAEICSIITDGTHQPPKFVERGIPFLFVSNIVTNEITYNAEKFISEETYEELYKRTPIEIGDIVLSTVGSYGHPAIVKTDRKFLFQRHIAYLKPIPSEINSIYLHSAILSNDIQMQIKERVKGIAQKTLNLSEIRKITIPVAPMLLQEQFAAFVSQTDKSKVVIETILSIIRRVKIYDQF